MLYLMSELKKLLHSFKFWIAVLLTYAMCWGAFYLKSSISVLYYQGTLNVFIWSLIDNELVRLVAPIAAVITYSTSMCDDMDSGVIKNLLLNISRCNYLIVKLVCSILAGALPMILGIGSYFLTLLITHPGASIKYNHYVGYVSAFYDRSMLLFALFYILHVAICSALLSLLGMGIAAWKRNRYFGVIIPVALQFILLCAGWIVIVPELARIAYYIIPSSIYKYLYEPLGETIYDAILVSGISFYIFILAWKKWRIDARL